MSEHGGHSHALHGGGADGGTSFAQGLGIEQSGLPSQDEFVGTRSSTFGILRRMKLSDVLQGINVTPNFLFLLLFVGFTAWLGVVYWVRHHEPLANHVLGTGNGAAQSASALADRRLVAGIKKTLPIRTSHETGEFYVPIPHGNDIIHSGHFGTPAHYASLQQSPSAVYAQTPQSGQMPLPAPPLPPMPAPQPQPTPLGDYYMQGANGIQSNPYAQQIPTGSGSAYMVPVPHTVGTRVKMIVNR